MYSLTDFGGMIADVGRRRAYIEAIAKSVRPGDVVADIGCGLGLFALLACRAGARKVFAIESGEIIHYARQLAAANGCADRIEFLHSDSRQIHLPERANVVVSDIRGALPLYGHAVLAIEDARRRFLVDGGIQIPQRDTLYAAIIEAESFYRELSSPWRNSLRRLDLSLPKSMVLNDIHQNRFSRKQLLTDPKVWGELDYLKSPSPRAGANVVFQTTRGGRAHGICVWFETLLWEEIGFSAAPGQPRTVYGQIFLPWLEPVAVSAGQEIQVELHADLVGENYIWRWETKVCAGNSRKIHFQQSTFQGARFSPQKLRRQASDYVPMLSEEGKVDRWLIEAMDGAASLQEIAQSAAKHFPQQFTRPEDAFRRISELAEKVCS